MKTVVLTWIKKELKKRGLNVVGPTHYACANGPPGDHVLKINELKVKVPKKRQEDPSVHLAITVDGQVVRVVRVTWRQPQTLSSQLMLSTFVREFYLGDPDLIDTLVRSIRLFRREYAERDLEGA